MSKLPKMPKVEVCLRRIDFIKEKSKVCDYTHLPVADLSC